MPTQNKLSRRDFLQVAGATLGVSVLACSGLGVLATRAPEITPMENQECSRKPGGLNARDEPRC